MMEGQPHVEEKDIDAMMAKELNKMSTQQREIMYEEIHGVNKQMEETSERIQSSLLAMMLALEQIQDKPPAYHLAVQQDAQYVSSPQLWLMWLRSVSFDATKAAEGLLKMLQMKLELFGEATLTRSVRVSDMLQEDVKYLRSGAYQFLPSRDRNGRAVFADCHLILPPNKDYKNPASVFKTLAYMFLSAAEDEETQKRGVVGICYFVGNFIGKLNHKMNKQINEMILWIPIRMLGVHLCFDDPRLRAWKPLAIMLMTKKHRLRLRIHDGTHTEVRYGLMTYGIPVDVLPITYQGGVKNACLLKWLQRRQETEDRMTEQALEYSSRGYVSIHSLVGIDLPARNDVLLQRGRIFQEHAGNLYMHQLIGQYQKQYEHASSKDKRQVAVRIVEEITARQGRFLERDSAGWWTVTTQTEAIKRVAKSIVTARTNSKIVPTQSQSASMLPVNMHSDDGGDMCGGCGNKRPRLTF